MIVLKDVSFQYEGCEEGVHGIDLTVCDGECVVLTGPSGGGKTTLTRLLNGLAPSYYQGTKKGDLWINYTEIASLPAWKIGQEIGSVFQDPKSQFFSSELAGEVAFACENYGMAKQEIRKRTDEAIASMGLETLRARPLDVLSSGEKQRVAVASVYALRPHTYVCDEPTANLDSEGATRLAGILRKLKDEGNTLIIAEHRLAWLSGIADRFVYVSEGTIQWEKTPAQMRELSEEERKRYGLREVTETEASLPGVPANAGEEHFFCRNLTCRRKKLLIFETFSARREDHRPDWQKRRGKNYPCHGSGGAAKAERWGNLYRRKKAACREAQKSGVVQFQRHRNPVFYHQRHGGIAAPFRCFLRAAGTCQNIVENTGVVCLQGYTPGCPFWRPEAETFYRLRLVIRKGNPAFRRTHVRAGRGKHAKNRCRIDSSRSRRQNDRGHHP